MNKQELVSAIASKSEMSKKDSEKLLEAFQEVVMETLAKGESIKLVGFGNFEVVDRKGKSGEMKRTDGTVIPWTTEDSKAPRFKPSKNMKQLFL